MHVFHSGYDFGYLIKLLSNANLPEEEVDFFEILRLYFPVIYDVKYLMKSCKNLKVLWWTPAENRERPAVALISGFLVAVTAFCKCVLQVRGTY